MNEQFDNGHYLEYTSAANPRMPAILPHVMLPDFSFTKTAISSVDLSKELVTDYRATTPNCLASFITILANESTNCTANATSHLFVVIAGSGTAKFADGEISWKERDVFAIPGGAKDILLTASANSVLYWVNDEPILNYLGVSPHRQIFAATLFPAEKIIAFANQFNQDEKAQMRNRNGVLLGNEACPLTKTVTPSLWALFNVIEPHSTQLPHRHNSVALDLSLSAKAGVYTLMGPELDEDGKIKNAQRFDWGNGVGFITPPGWWHAHINESDEQAIVLPVQDAGLQTYMRTLFIQFSSKR
jgi:gentisate 1,2-dioxygenase